MRLQKFLADAGIASRRKAEELIAAGRVEVNGRTVREMGFLVDPEKDEIKYLNQVVKPAKKKIYLNAFRTIPASFLNSGIRLVQIPQVTKMGLIGYLYSFLMTKVFSFHK